MPLFLFFLIFFVLPQSFVLALALGLRFWRIIIFLKLVADLIEKLKAFSIITITHPKSNYDISKRVNLIPLIYIKFAIGSEVL